MGRQLRLVRLEDAGAVYHVMSQGGSARGDFFGRQGSEAVFKEAEEGRSAENGIGCGTAQANGDDDGVDCQRIQCWRVK
jgi:hypothetical protein